MLLFQYYLVMSLATDMQRQAGKFLSVPDPKACIAVVMHIIPHMPFSHNRLQPVVCLVQTTCISYHCLDMAREP